MQELNSLEVNIVQFCSITRLLYYARTSIEMIQIQMPTIDCLQKMIIQSPLGIKIAFTLRQIRNQARKLLIVTYHQNNVLATNLTSNWEIFYCLNIYSNWLIFQGKLIGVPQKNGGILVCLFSVPKFIDPVFGLTSPIRSFCMTENESFGLVFPKNASINSGTWTRT